MIRFGRGKERPGPTYLCLSQRNAAATSKKLALPSKPVDIAVTSLDGRLDVLIHTEEIGWIVLALDGRQALIVVPVAGFDALLALFHHEIYVRAARRMGMQIVPVLSGPVHDAVLIGRVGIDSHNHLGPGGIPVAPRRLVLAHPMRRSVHRIEVHGRVHGRQLGAVLHVEPDRLVAQLIDKVRFPIVLEPGRVERIEHALERRMRDGADQVQGRRQKAPDRLERFLGLLQRPGVAPDYPTHFLVVEMLGKRRPRRHDQEGEETVDIIGCLRDELAIPLHHLRRLVQLPKHGAAIIGMDGVGLKHERSDDSEVSTTATQSPEKILMMPLVGSHQGAIGQHDVSTDQVVDRETAFTGQVPYPPAQGEPAHPGRGNDPAGYR
jgi:hypothetical protein